VEEKRVFYTVQSALVHSGFQLAKPHSNGILSSELAWISVTDALKEALKPSKIKLSSHASINACFFYINENYVAKTHQDLVEWFFDTATLLHENHYNNIFTLAEINKRAARVERLIQVLRKITITDGNRFLKYCKKRRLRIRDDKTDAGWKRVEGYINDYRME